MPSSRKRRILIAVIILASLIILPVTVIFPCVARNMEIPRQKELASVDSGEINFTTTFPPGTHFNFILGVPRSRELPPKFQGRLMVSEAGRQIVDCPISSGEMVECCWLDSPELQGYILILRDGGSTSIQELLPSRHRYDINVRFSQMPPEGSSLWLHWLQRGRD